MKKKNIVNLIRYYAEKNDAGFRNEAYQIARDFDDNGDEQLSMYIVSLLSGGNTFVPQSEEYSSAFFEKMDVKKEMLLLPECVIKDLLGIVHAVKYNIGIHRFLFCGAPGTGKTEAVKQLAQILEREVYMVNFASLIDSKLGQTQKNLIALCKEINSFSHPERVLVLFDEIDAIALNRTNSNDIREMSRVATEILKLLDRIDEDVVVVATTNLFEYFDKAILRRFDSVINFDRYSVEDMIEIAEKILDMYMRKLKLTNRDIRLFRKIIGLSVTKYTPGELKNLIKTALAFSDEADDQDYFRRLYIAITEEKEIDITTLREQGFTVREIEILAKKSKSSVARSLSKQG